MAHPIFSGIAATLGALGARLTATTSRRRRCDDRFPCWVCGTATAGRVWEDCYGSPLGGAFTFWGCPQCQQKRAVSPRHAIWFLDICNWAPETVLRRTDASAPVHVLDGSVYTPLTEWADGDRYGQLLARAITGCFSSTGSTGEAIDGWRRRGRDVCRNAIAVMRARGAEPTISVLMATSALDAMREAATDSCLPKAARQQIEELVGNTPGMTGLDFRPGLEDCAREKWAYQTMPLEKLLGGDNA